MQTKAVSHHILAEQVRLLYKQTTLGFLATVFNATVLVAVLLEVLDHRVLLAWYALMLSIIGARYALVKYYARALAPESEPRRWRDLFLVGAAATGICWGLAGTLLFPVHSVGHQMLVLITLAGMSAGAVPFLSSVTRVYIAYLVPTILPLAIWLFLQEGTIHVYIGLMVLLFFVVLVATSRRINDTLSESLRLRYENIDLINDLGQSKDELEATNRKLIDEIAERTRIEGELRDSYQFLERIMDCATNAIYVIDLGGRFVRLNHAASVLTGYEIEELIGQPFSVLFTPNTLPPVQEQFMRAAVHGEAVRSQETEIVRKDGHICVISFSGAPMREEGGISAVVGTAEDITERKKVERMKDEFISTVSHELRTPLTSIRGSLGLMRGDIGGELPEQAKQFTEIAYKNCDRLLNLINDLLDIQKLESGEMRFSFEICELPALVDHAVEINQAFADQYDVRLTVTQRLAAASANIDKERFIQVLTNLFSNAVKFSPAGQSVDISMRREEGNIHIAVSDRGPGIPGKFRSRVFQKFAQADASDAREKGGTGLGLAITKFLVEKMGGSIFFESSSENGTTFHVRIPEYTPSHTTPA